MNAVEPQQFKHTTLTKYPDKVVGITLLDEDSNFTGIYLRDENGDLWPARTVDRSIPVHYQLVIEAWLTRGNVVDLRG